MRRRTLLSTGIASLLLRPSNILPALTFDAMRLLPAIKVIVRERYRRAQIERYVREHVCIESVVPLCGAIGGNIASKAFLRAQVPAVCDL